MKNSLLQLRSKWLKEKDWYRTTEVGTGVQSFIKDVFESEDIFKLKEGRLSTDLHQRKNEFIHEKKAKELRKADFVIYITPEIIIPVEAECYGNLQAGENQLFKYQKDFERKYGILTDGHTWRFYNNNVFKPFTLDEILDNTTLFLEFWHEYIKPEFYYLSFFETVGQLALVEETKLYVEKYRQLFFEDITNYIQSFKNKLQIEGYLEGLDKKEKTKRAIEITYAYIIQFILYKTLVDNDFDDFGTEFKTNVSKIHGYLKQQRYKDILGIIDGISSNISKNIYRPFAKEQEFIKQKINELFHRVENELSDVSPWLDIFVFIKKYNFANVRNEIFGYIYENYLKELYEESKKGQYFTDPAVVNFMLEQVGFTPENVKKRYGRDKDSVSLIDPSCGSGTFLYAATDTIIRAFGQNTEEASKKIEDIVTKNIFGLDIEEFPLYLAEMNILMRMLPLIVNQKYNNPIEKKIKVFKTNDSVSEFMDTALRNTSNDMNIELQKNNGQMMLFTEKLNLGYSSYVRDEDDLSEMKKSLENQPECPRRRFDFVIGNPPYISYNECAKQGVLIFKLMKEGKAKLNDIYGVNLHSAPNNPKRYRPNPNLYSFFIALGLALLKDNGKLSYIVPQTFLINPDYDVLRYHLAKFTTIEKIIIFSGQMFIGRGLKQNNPITTSSLVLVVKRGNAPPLHEVEIIFYKNPDDEIEVCLQNILNGRKISKSTIKQNDLLISVSNWNFIKQDKDFITFYQEYKKSGESISIYYEHKLAEQYFHSRFYFDGGYDIDERNASKTSSDNSDYEMLKFPDYGYVVKDSDGFWPNERKPGDKYFIKLRQANQGYNLLDSKYKVIWPYLRNIRFVFSDKPVIWSRRTTNTYYGIGANDKSELFYLLSLLNSPITQKIIASFKLESESKRGIMVSSALLKKEIRVPKITEENKHIKDKIINLTETLLSSENIQLSELIDFSGIMRQKFDEVYVEANNLVLKKDSEGIKLKIKQDTSLIAKVIAGKFQKSTLKLEDKDILLSELISLPVIDFDKQTRIKDHIDDLVFALYFNIEISNNELEKPEKIKKLCQNNKFYKQVS